MYALGWMVIHSWWQASIIGLLLWACLYQLRQRDARLRYGLAYAALLLQWVVSLATWAYLYTPKQVLQPSTDWPMAAYAAMPAASTTEVFPWYELIITWIDGHTTWIVALWLVGMSFFAVRLLLGLAFIRRLRAQAQPLETGQVMLQSLTDRLGLHKPVRLMASADVSVPLVVGQLKPLILFPVGLINQLSPAQTEAILAHELAHIYRYDYWLNLLQYVIEAIFYYHPVIWWIGSVVRREREHCCDDVAVALVGNRVTYARTLLAMEAYQQPGSPLVPAFAAGKKQLLGRVERILLPNINQSDMRTKLVITGLLLVSAVIFSFRQPLQGRSADATTFIESQIDSLPIEKKRMVFVKEGQEVDVTWVNGKINALSIDGKAIPSDQLPAYEARIADMVRSMPVPPTPPTPPTPPGLQGGTEDIRQVQIFKEGDEQRIVITRNGSGSATRGGSDTIIIVDPQGRKSPDTVIVVNVRDGANAPGTMELRKADNDARRMVIITEDIEGPALGLPASPEGIRRIDITKNNEMIIQHLGTGSIESDSVIISRTIRLEDMSDGFSFGAGSPLIFKEITEGSGRLPATFFTASSVEMMLMREGVITDPGNYKMELTHTSLKIDGKRQSDELHRRVKAVYEVETGRTMTAKSRVVVDKND